MRWFFNESSGGGRSYEWKLLANHLTGDKEMVIDDKPYVILFFYMCYEV